jgi:hypothetical protein
VRSWTSVNSRVFSMAMTGFLKFEGKLFDFRCGGTFDFLFCGAGGARCF